MAGGKVSGLPERGRKSKGPMDMLAMGPLWRTLKAALSAALSLTNYCNAGNASQADCVPGVPPVVS